MSISFFNTKALVYKVNGKENLILNQRSCRAFFYRLFFNCFCIVPVNSNGTSMCLLLQINAMANKAAGKGYENTDFYENVKFQFVGIENIHVMRQSLQKMTECKYCCDFIYWLWFENSKRSETAHERILLFSQLIIVGVKYERLESFRFKDEDDYKHDI